MSGGKGKRGPSAPLASTSDEDEPGEVGQSPSPVSSSHTEHDYALPDHDYENVSSPGNSSTASGPTYVRQPGFTHHAHEVTASATPPPAPPPTPPSHSVAPSPTSPQPHPPTPAPSPNSAPTDSPVSPHLLPTSSVSRPKIKKKKTALLSVRDGLKKREPTPPKTRPKREPLPMRLRALPQSFWQQPNVPHTVSPGTAYPILPPLCTKDDEEGVDELRPVTPTDESESRDRDRTRDQKPPRLPERKITVANTDLLFKLFEGIESERKSSLKQRGRPKKVVPCSNKTFVSGEDPYLVDCMSEKLFPQLSLENCGRTPYPSQNLNSYGGGNTVLHLVTINEGDKCISLPSLSVEQNYSQMLSELVMHI